MKTLNLLMSIAVASLLAVPLSTTTFADPIMHKGEAKTNQFWWPEQLNLSPLRAHNASSNPLGESFNYAKAFEQLDLQAVKKDIDALLTTSQDWWPADYGNYGPFLFVWRGTVQAHTVCMMDAAVQRVVNNALNH